MGAAGALRERWGNVLGAGDVGGDRGVGGCEIEDAMRRLVVEGDDEGLDGTINAVTEFLGELKRFRASYVERERAANGTIPVVDLDGENAFDEDVVMGKSSTKPESMPA